MPTPLSSRLIQIAKRLNLKKSYGQHFLVSEIVLAQIASLAYTLFPAEHVVEIGPGAGFLTEALAKHYSHITAIEADPEMRRYLQNTFLSSRPASEQEPSWLRLIPADVLKFDWGTLSTHSPGNTPPWTIVGNLPYNIATPILFQLCGDLQPPQHQGLGAQLRGAVFMLQKEVAERVVAQPGSKAYNAMSITLQLWAEAQLHFVLPPNVFSPPPKVESAIISLKQRRTPLVPEEKHPKLGLLIRAAFAKKRKTLKNALTMSSVPLPKAYTWSMLLQQAGIEESRRPETLSIQEYETLTDVYTQIL